MSSPGAQCPYGTGVPVRLRVERGDRQAVLLLAAAQAELLIDGLPQPPQPDEPEVAPAVPPPPRLRRWARTLIPPDAGLTRTAGRAGPEPAAGPGARAAGPAKVAAPARQAADLAADADHGSAAPGPGHRLLPVAGTGLPPGCSPVS